MKLRLPFPAAVKAGLSPLWRLHKDDQVIARAVRSRLRQTVTGAR